MKYNQIKSLKGTTAKFIDDSFFVIDERSGSFNVYDKTSFNLIKSFYNNCSGKISIINNTIVDDSLRGFDRSSLAEVVLFQGENFYTPILNKQHLIVCRHLQDYSGEYYVCNKSSLEIIDKLDIKGNVEYFFDNGLICGEEYENVLVANIYTTHFEKLWCVDTFNDLFPEYNLKGNEDFPFRISEIKVYDGDFIVVTTAGIARLDALTGKTIWKTEKLRCKWIEIVEQIGYISGGNKLSKVNLNTGEISGYGWDTDILPNIEYEGNQYIAWGARFVYNDRLLWYSSNSGGVALIVAIDPKDGSYVWVERVDSEHIYEPQFHEDKMYISDINGNLFIYQKQD